jgi:hypothetical protein
MQNDKQIYMELKNIKHGKIERVKVYYEGIHKLAHGLQTPILEKNLTNVFQARLQSYLRITTTEMERTTLQLHKEVAMVCEKIMTLAKAQTQC